MSGAAIVFFAFIGFDAVSTTAEETKNPQRDLPIGIIASLIICTVLYVLMAGVMTGMKKYNTYLRRFGGGSDRVGGRPLAQALISAGRARWSYLGIAGFSIRAAAHFHGHGPRRIASQYFAKIHRRFRTPYITTIWTGIAVGVVAMLTDIGSLADLTNIGTLFAFMLVCLGVIVLRRKDADRPRPISGPARAIVPTRRRLPLHRADAESAVGNLGPFLYLAGDWALDLFPYGCASQQTAARRRRRPTESHPAAAQVKT